MSIVPDISYDINSVTYTRVWLNPFLVPIDREPGST